MVTDLEVFDVAFYRRVNEGGIEAVHRLFPDSVELRAELDVGDDIIDPQIREVELRNWLRFIDSRTA